MQKVNKVKVMPFVGKAYNMYLGGRLRDRVGRYAKEKVEVGFSLTQRIERWAWAMAKKWLIYPTIIASVITAVLFVSGNYVVKAYMEKVEPIVHTITKEVAVYNDPLETPVMQRILKAESGGHHFDPKTGKVLTGREDKDDTGKWQINFRFHGKAANCLNHLLGSA